MSLEERPKRSGQVGTALVVVVVIVVAAAAFISIRQRYTSTGLYRIDYEGRIVDKSVTVTESETGSGVKRLLRIRANNGEEFQVYVNRNLYEQAKVGMWVKSKAGSAELTPDTSR